MHQEQQHTGRDGDNTHPGEVGNLSFHAVELSQPTRQHGTHCHGGEVQRHHVHAVSLRCELSRQRDTHRGNNQLSDGADEENQHNPADVHALNARLSEEDPERQADNDQRCGELHGGHRLTFTPLGPQGGEHHAEDNDEDRVDGVDQVRAQFHAQNVPVKALIRVHCHHGELLLVQRPEHGVCNPQGDERGDAGTLIGGDVLSAQHLCEQGDSTDKDEAHDPVLEVTCGHQAGRQQDTENNYDTDQCQVEVTLLCGGEGGAHVVYGGGQVLAGQGVLNQAGSHTDSSQAKAEVEAASLPAPTGQERAKQRTGVHADVEDGEACVAAVVVVRVEGVDQHGGVTLQATGADSDQ